MLRLEVARGLAFFFIMVASTVVCAVLFYMIGPVLAVPAYMLGTLLALRKLLFAQEAIDQARMKQRQDKNPTGEQ